MKSTKSRRGQTKQSSSSPTYLVTLGDAHDISNVGALCRQMEEALQSEQSLLTIDAEQVSRIDGAALQALLMFCREANSRGYRVRWKKPSASMLRAVNMIGLSAKLGLNESMSQ